MAGPHDEICRVTSSLLLNVNKTSLPTHAINAILMTSRELGRTWERRVVYQRVSFLNEERGGGGNIQ